MPKFGWTGERVKLGLLAAAGVGVGVFALWYGARPARGNFRVPEPCRELDLNRYLGKWYELFRYDASFERGCEGVTAEYELLADGKIGVKNTCHRGSPTGPVKAVIGKARIVPGSGNAKLKVSFFGPFYIGNYWVLDRAEDYSWSIVGEGSGRYLWILRREAHPEVGVREMLVRRAGALGYDTRRLRVTQHF